MNYTKRFYHLTINNRAEKHYSLVRSNPGFCIKDAVVSAELSAVLSLLIDDKDIENVAKLAEGQIYCSPFNYYGITQIQRKEDMIPESVTVGELTRYMKPDSQTVEA